MSGPILSFSSKYYIEVIHMTKEYKNSCIKLSEALPLDTPLRIMIDPTNACNFKCTFCPTGSPELLKSVGRKIANMKLDNFKKIIDDISKFPQKIKKLSLYKDGEPLINKNIVEMIDYAKTSNVTECIAMTTNASLLTRKKSIQIIEAGLDEIRISVEHVSDADYLEVTGTFGDYHKIIENVSALWEECARRDGSLSIHVKILDANLTEEQRQTFMSDFSPISDLINIDNLMGWSGETGSDWMGGDEPATGMDGKTPLKADRKVCPSPFYGLNINSNGSVSLCCVDWSHQTVIGNAFDTSIVDMWNGDKINEFRSLHLRGERSKISVCKDCQYVLGEITLSDLDDAAERLIPVYS